MGRERVDMKLPYEYYTKPLEDYYLHQVGNGLPFYSGVVHQRGYGLGNIFGSIFRTIFPFLKQGAKKVGKELLKTGVSVASDVIQGENIKTATKRRFEETGKTLAEQAIKKAKTMIGAGNKKKRPKRKPIILAKVSKRCASKDIFS